MNIAMFTNTYSPMVGGVERSVSTFASLYEREGHRVLIVAPEFRGGEQSDDRTLRVPAIKNFNNSEFSVRIPVPLLIRERLEQFRPNIIHAHHPFLLGDSALRFAYEHNVPLVFTHHTWYEEYTHNVPFDSDALKRLVIELGVEYANLCQLVIAPSLGVADVLRTRGVTTPIQVAPTGIDIEAFARGDRERFRRRFNLPANSQIIGHVGRLSNEKNLTYLANAVSTALKQCPDGRFLVVGKGPLLEEIQRIFMWNDAADRLCFTGVQTGQDLADAYAAMDIFVFSSHSETQGLVVAEAMSAGLPVVALDACGVNEVVQHRKNGILLKSNATPDAFAKALIRLLNSAPTRIRTLSNAARRTAKRFDQRACVRSVLEHYQSLLQDASGEAAADSHFWDRLANRIEAEWKLIVGKTSAAIHSVSSSERREES